MKTTTFFLIIIDVLIHSQIFALKKNVTLLKAINDKQISIKANSLGGYKGDCVHIELKNLSPDSLEIIIESGTTMVSENVIYQDILITKQENISLKSFETKAASLTGFCCRAKKCGPQKGNKFKPMPARKPELKLLASYISKAKYSNDVIQNAIWAVSDSFNTALVIDPKDSLVKKLRSYVCKLKNEIEPWYEITSKTLVYLGGSMQNFNLQLSGILPYVNPKYQYAYLEIINEKGKKIGICVGDWLQEGAHNYQINIPVAGLPDGKYQVTLSANNTIIASREFKL
ncbi:MAG: hypothetical protein JSU07_08220 [Bacteroidetes bacterium]|nr:hypothetical protein [Bacteroidota bacterium]